MVHFIRVKLLPWGANYGDLVRCRPADITKILSQPPCVLRFDREQSTHGAPESMKLTLHSYLNHGDQLFDLAVHLIEWTASALTLQCLKIRTLGKKPQRLDPFGQVRMPREKLLEPPNAFL